MSQPWDAPSSESWLPPPPFGDDGVRDGVRDEVVVHEHHHDGHHHDGYRPYAHHSPRAPLDLRTQVRGQYGHGVSVGDLLSFLDFRVNELYAALLEPDRHASRVPGSPVRMAGIDALLNTDAAAFRSLTELGARLDRVEAKLDTLLERLPER